VKRLTWLFLSAWVGLSLFTGTTAGSAKDFTFGYITPGPDTWYKRDVDGFVLGAKILGVKTVVLNSTTMCKEVSNIDSLITQGVNGMAIFRSTPKAPSPQPNAKMPAYRCDSE
jgi:ABC-type sugar transport system substrate-binding protein